MRNKMLIIAASAALVMVLGAAQKDSHAEAQLQAAINKEMVEGELKTAIEMYAKIAQSTNRAVAAKALVRMGQCYEKLGDGEARKPYERVVREFADQKEAVEQARSRLTALGQPSVASTGMVAQLIAKGPDVSVKGRITPDGKLYYFVDPKTGDISVRDLRNGEIRHLTHEGQSDEHRSLPVPSRDGRQIAFSWAAGGGVPMELRVINVTGSGMRTLPVRLASHDWLLVRDWSPDGKSLLVQGQTHQPHWWGFGIIEIATGELRRLGPGNSRSNVEGGAFSPDGRWVIYSRTIRDFDDPDWDIFAFDTKTWKETAVVTGAGPDRNPEWVPDTDKILFRSDRSGRNAIWMTRFKDGRGSAPIIVNPDAGDYEPAGISRDGSLFYGLVHESKDVYQATVDPQTLRVQNTPARLIEDHLGHNSMPMWSPSGAEFAYFSQRDNASRLVVRHGDGKETTMQPVRTYGFLHWCSDGDHLGTPYRNSMQLFNSHTGEALPFDLIKGRLHTAYQLINSPDCRSAYVSMHLRAEGSRMIYRYDYASGKETNLLADAGEWAVNPRVSPDGRWLALYGSLDGGKKPGLLLLSTAGGQLRMLDPDEYRMGFHLWTPDSKRLMYIRRVDASSGQGEENEMYWVSVEGGIPQSMGIRRTGATAPSLNADGKRILFSASDHVNELWVLRGLPLN